MSAWVWEFGEGFEIIFVPIENTAPFWWRSEWGNAEGPNFCWDKELTSPQIFSMFHKAVSAEFDLS